MLCHYVTLLVTAIFLAGLNAQVATADSKMGDFVLSTKRGLRIHTDAMEERGFNMWTTKAVPELLLADDQLQQLAKVSTSSDNVFKLLKLDDGLDGILSNPI
ncbi:secreted RxLR effector peptide protein, putative [Phytophthora infestans T30-4]|uniref:Secreted RxLR effector peptide protein, putative n=1 Tax=Phytophthora infestans (strain T30-4) TaxID=403677 RepID=D0N0F3_PHYIT|nr:secreted RxLR effector peptide protein, putative [Phytophthora infestans T30-4]EEY67116.1 secreted RxLR effector peptide protein, putative [Phytophthora infestans T30-4]|eukprot:XP_002905764.1 secreted RxLR effector peptide protein, putative [Phytophthora infestans T30-4]